MATKILDEYRVDSKKLQDVINGAEAKKYLFGKFKPDIKLQQE